MSNLIPVRSPLASLEGSDVGETGHGLDDWIHLLDRDTNNVRTAVEKVHNSERDTDDDLSDIKDNPFQHDAFEEYAEGNVHHDADNPEDIRDNAGQVDEKASGVDPSINLSDHDSNTSDEFYFLSLGRDSWVVNDDMYFRRVARLIKTKFYGREFKGKPVLAFARHGI